MCTKNEYWEKLDWKPGYPGFFLVKNTIIKQLKPNNSESSCFQSRIPMSEKVQQSQNHFQIEGPILNPNLWSCSRCIYYKLSYYNEIYNVKWYIMYNINWLFGMKFWLIYCGFGFWGWQFESGTIGARVNFMIGFEEVAKKINILKQPINDVDTQNAGL